MGPKKFISGGLFTPFSIKVETMPQKDIDEWLSKKDKVRHESKDKVSHESKDKVRHESKDKVRHESSGSSNAGQSSSSRRPSKSEENPSKSEEKPSKPALVSLSSSDEDDKPKKDH